MAELGAGAERPWILAGPALRQAPRSWLGGKAAQLLLLQRLDLPVPEFVVVPVEAFDAVLEGPALRTLVDRGEWEALRSALLEAPLPAGLPEALESARVALGPGPVALRSSALAEDAAGHSFAGQFDSFLALHTQAEVEQALRRCWASAYSERVRVYAARQGIAPAGMRMAVVMQRMLAPAAAGVLFTRDPADPAAGALLSAAWGLGEGVVSGQADADSYRLRDGVVSAALGDKRQQVVALPAGGTALAPVPEAQRAAACLSDAQVRALVAMGQRLEDHLGAPQDVEWALLPEGPGDARLVLLQTRPLAGAAAQGGRRAVWDNSNIIESYEGVTTPLTYSFARSAYEVVYRQFCELMGVDAATISANASVFRVMIGLLRGRIYYRLNSWYQVLSLLPGFASNRRFMEQMMGVGEQADLLDPEASPPPPGFWGRLFGPLRVGYLFWRLLRALFGLGPAVREFMAQVDQALSEYEGQDLALRPMDELVRHYRQLERRLLQRWKAPIVNDFFAMIFFGLLARQVRQRGLDASGSLHNDLLCGEGGLASTEPTRELVRMAHRIRQQPALVAAFGRLDDAALLAALPHEPALQPLQADLTEFLRRWGARCPNELKLEEPTLQDDPTFVIGVLRGYIEQGDLSIERLEEREAALRQAAEAVVRRRLHGPRCWLFGWILGRARRHIRERENMRFARTRVFGLVRRIFRALGDHLARRGVLDRPEDVFYLSLDELLGFVEGTTVSAELGPLATLRRAEFARYRTLPAPARRFETRGPVHYANPLRGAAPPASEGGALTLQGIGCAPGVVRAPARIVRNPAEAPDLRGEILVAERTDPGWVPLFLSAAGILVERGSALSHSAIVAREFGVPTVVGLAGLLERVGDGQVVELDGASGRVDLDPERAAPAAAEPARAAPEPAP